MCKYNIFWGKKAFRLAKGSYLALDAYSFMPSLFRLLFGRFFIMPSASFVSFPILFGKMRRFLFFLVGVGFLSVVLIACAGGGGGSGGGSGSVPSSADDDGDGIPNNLDRCSDGETGWTSNSSADHDGDGCLDTSSEDTDDDNDGLNDSSDLCSTGIIGWERNNVTDNDGDGCRDRDEDDDDDNDGLDDGDEPAGCGLDSDCDDDDVRDGDEVAAKCVQDTDCDDDGLGDNDAKERQANSNGESCSLSEDCDGDSVTDIDEAAVNCVIDDDCDDDNAVDGTDVDDDGDGLIEIRTHEELDAVRYALDGSGRRSLDGGALDSTGCGDGSGVTSCSGYELVADISLATYADADGGKGWQPLGHDTGDDLGCQGDAFEGTFEGNGWTISNLSISRSGQDCVGLFGHIAQNSEIRNLTLRAEAVIGKARVGGLVGSGNGARIVSSSVVVAEVRGVGSNSVGGLVGFGNRASIHSSSVVVGEVRGNNYVGGLMGSGVNSRIHSSSVVMGQLIKTGSGRAIEIGGLVGNGQFAQIHSSSVVVDEVRGGSRDAIGGLMGSANDGRIVSSSVVVGEVIGSGFVGGLVGTFEDGKVAYSYVVSGSGTAMLVEQRNAQSTGVASYWDSDTSGVTSGNTGAPQTTNELRSPTNYTDIYASWDEDMDIFGNEDEPLAVWCDRDHSGSIEEGENIDDNLIWDFGESDQYPAIRCTPIRPADWRDWWSLNASGKPQLDRDRLNQLLP